MVKDKIIDSHSDAIKIQNYFISIGKLMKMIAFDL